MKSASAIVVHEQEAVVRGNYETQPILLQDLEIENTSNQSVTCEFDYLITLQGSLRLVQLAIGLMVFALATPAYVTSGSVFFMSVAIGSFIVSFIWCLYHMFTVKWIYERFSKKAKLRIILTELLFSTFTTLLYFIAICVQLSFWSTLVFNGLTSVKIYNIIAGALGALATAVYAGQSCFLFFEWTTCLRQQNHEPIR